MKNTVESIRPDDVFFPMILSPVGKVPLIAGTMTDEREREIAKKYPFKHESEATNDKRTV